MIEKVFKEEAGGAGGTIPDGTWQRINLATWSLSDGAVANLVTDVTSTNIEVADLTANNFGDWSILEGPALEPSTSYMLYVRRTNAGARDRAGLCVGFVDTADNAPIIVGGQFETATSAEFFGRYAGSGFATTDADSTYAITTVVTDSSGSICSGISTGFDSSDAEIAGEGGDLTDATSTPKMVAYVRHGTTGVGSPSNVNYELWLRKCANLPG